MSVNWINCAVAAAVAVAHTKRKKMPFPIVRLIVAIIGSAMFQFLSFWFSFSHPFQFRILTGVSDRSVKSENLLASSNPRNFCKFNWTYLIRIALHRIETLHNSVDSFSQPAKYIVNGTVGVVVSNGVALMRSKVHWCNRKMRWGYESSAIASDYG